MTDLSDAQLLAHADRVRDKVAIITGGAGGIGREAALLFAKHGAKIVIGDIDTAGSERVAKEVEELGSTCIFQRCDVTKWEDQLSLFELAHSTFGSVDIVVANAGVAEIGRFTEPNMVEGKLLPPNCKTVEINVYSVVYSSNLALHYLKLNQEESTPNDLKAIVLVGSMASWQSPGGGPLYTSSKHAVLGLMRGLAPACAVKGIRIGSVHPWFAETQILNPALRVLLAGVPKTPLDRIAACIICVVADPDSTTSGKPWLLPDGGEVLRLESAEISESVYAVINWRARRLAGAVRGIRYIVRTTKELGQVLGPKITVPLILLTVFGLRSALRISGRF